MSGPTVGILLKEKLSNNELMFLYQTIKSNCSEFDEIDLSCKEYNFRIDQTKFNGVNYYNQVGLPFGIEINDSLEDLDLDGINQVMQFIPQQEIIIIAYTNGQTEHRILGILAIMLAEKFNGIIDMGGEISISLKDVKVGTLWRVPSEIGGGKLRFNDFVDLEFLKNWIQSSDFRMIK